MVRSCVRWRELRRSDNQSGIENGEELHCVGLWELALRGR